MPHTHQHHVPARINAAFAIAVLLNLGFTIIEAIYGVMANSMSLLGDAGHNLGDVLGLLLAWGANWLLSKPRTQRYSYGYKRATIIAAIINAIILIATAVLIAYESVIKLIHPEETKEMIVIVIAFIGILINGGTAVLFWRGSKVDLNIKGAFLHLSIDALISIGVVVAGIIMLFTNGQWIDPVVGLIIVAVILYSSWELFRDSVFLLLDGVPHHINFQEVENYFNNIAGVKSTHNLHIWGLSTREIALTVHLIMPDQPLNDDDFKKINHDLHEKFAIHHITIQVEKGNNHHCKPQEICT